MRDFVMRDFVIIQIVQRCVPVSPTGGMARWGWGTESCLSETPGIRWVLSGNTARSFPLASVSVTLMAVAVASRVKGKAFWLRALWQAAPFQLRVRSETASV